MTVIQKGIILNEDSTLSFGNYELDEKLKISNFIINNDIYKVTTCKDITRFSKNGKLLLESVPGTTIHNFFLKDDFAEFFIEGFGDVLITVVLEPHAKYSLNINHFNLDKINTNLSGKINFSITLSGGNQQVQIKKVEF